MSFSLVQTVTDRAYGFGEPPVWIDRSVPALEEGSPIGLLLALTYTN